MLPEEVTRYIGQTLDTRILEVERGAIKKFADAVDDRNPLYWDEEFARNSKYGSLIAPPGFFGWPIKWAQGTTFIHQPEGRSGPTSALVKAGFGRNLDGGMEWDFYQPVRAGDTLVATTIVKDIVEREGKTGKFALLITETTYTNQNGDVVAKARATGINR